MNTNSVTDNTVLKWTKVEDGIPDKPGEYLVRIEADEGEYLEGHRITPPYPAYTTIFDIREVYTDVEPYELYGEGQHDEIWEQVTCWLPLDLLPEPPDDR